MTIPKRIKLVKIYELIIFQYITEHARNHSSTVYSYSGHVIPIIFGLMCITSLRNMIYIVKYYVEPILVVCNLECVRNCIKSSTIVIVDYSTRYQTNEEVNNYWLQHGLNKLARPILHSNLQKSVK